MILTSTERDAIQALITLAHATHLALDDSEEFVDDDGRCYRISGQAFDDVEATLETLDELPDDKPGEALSPSGRAEWALRRLLCAGASNHQQVAPAAVLVAEVADNLVRDWNRRGKMPGMAWGFRELVEAGILAYISAMSVAQMDALTQAARDVLAERQRQVSVEGWTPEHDDEHNEGQMAGAAGCYARHVNARAWVYGAPGIDDYASEPVPDVWPLDENWWKPSTPRRDLVKAGALILAELERMDRAAVRSEANEVGAA